MEIINDFVVEPEDEQGWCGILVKIGNKAVWIFNNRPHGYDVAFGLV